MNFLTNKSCQEIRKIVCEESTSFVYFSDDDSIKTEDINKVKSSEDYVTVPQVDIEQSVRALCLAKEGKSSAVYSPFYESKYMPFPLIISGRKLLFEAENSLYLVIGSRLMWQTILKNVYCHGDVGNHPMSGLGRFRDISEFKNRDRSTKRRSPVSVRWIFSGFFNSDLWGRLTGVSLIIVDLVTNNRSKIRKPEVEAILSYARRHEIAVVFFIKNYMSTLAKYLKENGVEISTPPIDIPAHSTRFAPSIHTHHARDEELKGFLTDYNLRSWKINRNGIRKIIELRVTEEEGYLRTYYQKYIKFVASLRSWDPNDTGNRAYYLSSKLCNSIMEFTGSVNSNVNGKFSWISHPIGDYRNRFYDAIWNLSKPSQTLALELIDEADHIMKRFESQQTPKGESLSELLTSYEAQKMTMVIVTKKSAMKGFLQNTFPAQASSFEQYMVEPDQLENASASDIMILLNPVYGKHKTKLLTSCSGKILILTYPWQVGLAEKSVKEIKEFLSGEGFSSLDIKSETSYKAVDPIEVLVTGAIGQSDRNDKELVEIGGESLIDFFDSNKSGDLLEDDMDKDADEDDSHSGTPSDNSNPFGIQKWVVSIENREVIIPENRNIVLLKEQKTHTVKAQKLKPGDKILITRDFNPKSLSDFVWDIMERKLGIMRKTHPGNEWREKLKRYVIDHPGITYSQILDELNQMGDAGIETPAAIYLWLESYDIIGPLRFKTLQSIAKLVNSENRAKIWWAGILYIRKRHRRITNHLWKVFTYWSKEIREMDGEDYVVDPVLGIKISEISKLVHFGTVTRAPRRVDDLL